MPLQELTLADTPEALTRGLAALAELDTVGVDVERADWQRYFRVAALVQVGGQGRVVVVDPLALDDLAPLEALLADRVAVFHAMENDLVPLASAGVRPARVADTAIAAAMLGLPTGLEALLRDLLDVDLPGDKAAMQRSDWEARPLEENMIAYAAADVADLPALWETLHARLVASGRLAWYEQELAATRALPPVDERREWTKLKGIGRLDEHARARVRALWDTRELLARRTDTAPGRIAADRILVDLATKPPRTRAELGRRGMRRQAIREFGDELVAAAADARDLPPDPARQGRTPTDRDRAHVERLRALRAGRAAELDIDPGVLCPSRTLMSAVLCDPRSAEELRAALGLRPWQWEQLGAAFCKVLGIDPQGTPAPESPTAG